MFKVTGNGFHMAFKNGVTVSVQWDEGNYSHKTVGRAALAAEVAAWDAEGAWITKQYPGNADGQDFIGWVDADGIADFIAWAKNREA